mmetsp:Transcript_6829/g.13961  ORF Transcript_6829/g.13961 Transcript_6829/m.13961 type:complete len:111 (-) Transcript_6829:2073-2405(-)
MLTWFCLQHHNFLEGPISLINRTNSDIIAAVHNFELEYDSINPTNLAINSRCNAFGYQHLIHMLASSKCLLDVLAQLGTQYDVSHNPRCNENVHASPYAHNSKTPTRYDR